MSDDRGIGGDEGVSGGMEERLFYAVPLPGPARLRVAEVIRDAQPIPTARWIRTENLHLTLRFLGATTPEQKARVEAMVRKIAFPDSFTISLQGWGAFPRPARAEVLWIGVDDEEGGLASLAGALEAAARTAGFPPERRPFRPHLTAARLRPAADIRQIIPKLHSIDLRMRVEAVVLLRSTLGRGPAVYEPIGYHPLEGGPGGNAWGGVHPDPTG